MGRKADIDIRTSKIGTKYQLDLEKVGEAATGLIDNQPPSPTRGGAVSAGKAIVEEGIYYTNKIGDYIERTSNRRSNSNKIL